MSRMPQLTARDLIRFLKARGFTEDRRSGSHPTLEHEQRGVTLTIPVHTGCDVVRGPAVRILKDAGFSADDYLGRR
jgi:predicted RNA binding protein YcfA (HicA-like mRNA interferase family)